VIGRHQNPFKECHLSVMERENVVLARRYSGGGAVYQVLHPLLLLLSSSARRAETLHSPQDLGNTNFTFLSNVGAFDKVRCVVLPHSFSSSQELGPLKRFWCVSCAHMTTETRVF